jgi:hypothetical protein
MCQEMRYDSGTLARPKDCKSYQSRSQVVFLQFLSGHVMKQSLLLLILLVAVPCALRAQSIVMTPDSGYNGQNFSITIVGMGTHFESTLNVSNINARLVGSGNINDYAYSVRLINDSTIIGSLTLAGMPTGYCELVVQTPDSTFRQSSAFYVTTGPASIISVNPESAYDSQTVNVRITGQNTNFQNGTAPTIYFYQNGTLQFTAQADSVFSNTLLGAQVSVPSPPTGYYDVVVQNNVYSDTGRQLFRVLGPMPTVALVPDSGMVSSTLEVSIVGQGTSFAVNGGVSVPLNLNLKQGGVIYYHTHADSVTSQTLAYATITLSDSISPGIYDAEVYGQGNNGPYDLYTTFLVTAHHTTIRTQFHYSAKPADTVTIGVTGKGVHFIYHGNQFATTVKLLSGAYSISATTVKVKNDTSLVAFFSIPPNATPGFYNVTIVEPGTGLTDTGKSEFVVEGVVIDTSGKVTPNSGQQGETITLKFPISAVLEIGVSGIYLQMGKSIITGSLLGYLSDSASFQIPTSAETVAYDVVRIDNWGGAGSIDSVLFPHAFTVEAASSVQYLDAFDGLVNGLRVSPNPAQDIASISFTMGAPSHVRLILFDALGRTVATLCDRAIGTGFQNFEWSASDMPAGSYFYELTAGEDISSRRIVIQH